MKKYLVVVLICLLSLVGCELSINIDKESSSIQEDVVLQEIDQIIDAYLENHVSSDVTNYVDVAILTHLGKLDEFISEEEFNENITKETIESVENVSQALKYSVILKAFNQDLNSFEGVSLVEKLASLNKISLFESLYGLMVLNNYDKEKSEAVKTYFDNLIVDLTTVNTPKVATPDLGGTTLIALAPYYDELEEVKDVVDEYASWISSEVQLDNGAVPDTYMGENSATLAQVIMGLVANNIDPRSEEFTKGENDLITAILEYSNGDGSFKYKLEDEDSDLFFSTPQSVLALVVYKKFVNQNQAVNAFII